MIQDYILFFTTTLFTISLVVQVFKVYKSKSCKDFSWFSVISTTIAMYIVCVVFITLKLYFSGIVNFINASLWLILFIAKIIFRDK